MKINNEKIAAMYALIFITYVNNLGKEVNYEEN